MKLATDIKAMEVILTKAERIGVLSEIITSFNSEEGEEKSDQAEYFISHLANAITDLSDEIVSITYRVSLPGIMAAQKNMGDAPPKTGDMAYKASEIARMTGKSTRAIEIRSQKEAWNYTEKIGRGRGGKTREYPFSALPPDVQNAVAQNVRE